MLFRSHKWYWLSFVILLRDSQEFLEILNVNFFLAREVCLESLTREEAIKTLSVVDMGFSVQEDPIGRPEELVGGIDDAWLDEGRRIEDFACHVASRGNDDESVLRIQQLASN